MTQSGQMSSKSACAATIDVYLGVEIRLRTDVPFEQGRHPDHFADANIRSNFTRAIGANTPTSSLPGMRVALLLDKRYGYRTNRQHLRFVCFNP
jgi:hypothetical protein